LESVIIGNDVTVIGQQAFRGCKNLSSMVVGESVQTIDSQAFYQCAFTSINIPASVTSINEMAFRTANKLKTITVAEESTTYKVVDNVLYKKDSEGQLVELVLYVLNNAAEEFTIPNGVQKIGAYAFYSCDNLKTVTIPASVTMIGQYAFDSCNNLTNVIIEGTEIELGENVFISKTNVTAENLTTVTLWGCDPEKKTGGDIDNFSDRTKWTTVTITSGEIAAEAFKDHANLTTLTIKDATAIAKDAFNGCTNLASVDLGKVQTIGDRAFMKTALTSVVVPETVTSLGANVFNKVETLQSVVVNAKITTLPAGTFRFCTNLKEIVLSDSITSIANTNAFGSIASASVYYKGAATTMFDGISNVTVYFYSATAPTTEGKFWHYVDGVPTSW
jgi:hypothetical protein